LLHRLPIFAATSIPATHNFAWCGADAARTVAHAEVPHDCYFHSRDPKLRQIDIRKQLHYPICSGTE
jgi:hypothetical protein